MPDDLTVRLWKSKIEAQERSQNFKPDIDFLVLDGIPRNVEQARIMEAHVQVHQVFHLSLQNRDELARRLRKRALKDNRLDDASDASDASDAVIARRIELYERESKPMLDCYDNWIITRIDAVQHTAQVMLEILQTTVKLDVFLNAPKV